MNKWKTFGLCIALTGTLSLCAAGAVAATTPDGGTAVYTALGAESTASDEDLSIQEVVKNSMPAMVSITNTSVQNVRDYFGGNYDFFNDFFNDFFGYGYGYGGNGFGYPGGGQTREAVSLGSGVIVGETDDDILIATNKHVVADSTELSVGFVDESAASAEILGTSESVDLALIKVSKSDLSKETQDAISIIPIGSSDSTEVGEQVVAIGNALGYGQSASAGIISAKGRTINIFNEMSGQLEEADGLLQTDAAINPGNSGGALLNMRGELIGINNAKKAQTDIEGVGYAIPIDKAEPILSDIANGKTPEADIEAEKEAEEKPQNQEASDIEEGDGDAHLGVTVVTVTEDYARSYNITTGAYVNGVTPGSAADKAGIYEGDIITALDGEEVKSSTDLKNLISHYSKGDEAELTLVRYSNSQNSFGRGGSSSFETITITVTFGAANDGDQA